MWVFGAVAVSAALWLRLTPVELAIICLTCGAVLTMELINTALESVVDLTVATEFITNWLKLLKTVPPLPY